MNIKRLTTTSFLHQKVEKVMALMDELDRYIKGGDLGVSEEVGNKIQNLNDMSYHKFASITIKK